MSATIDISGQRFGMLVALERARKDSHNRWMWRCKCDCGNEVEVMIGNLRNGRSTSCGCKRRKTLGALLTVHGMTDSRLHRIWRAMKTRCSNASFPSYPNYGGRGITVCPEWNRDFKAFYNWAISHGYSDNLTIDRIDNNGNYEPANCRWATRKEQTENTRRTRRIEFNGETHSIAEWARRLGFCRKTLSKRLDRLSVAEAFSKGAL